MATIWSSSTKEPSLATRAQSGVSASVPWVTCFSAAPLTSPSICRTKEPSTSSRREWKVMMTLCWHWFQGCKLYIGIADCTIFLWAFRICRWMQSELITSQCACRFPCTACSSLASWRLSRFWNILVTKLKLKKELLNLNHSVWDLVVHRTTWIHNGSYE